MIWVNGLVGLISLLAVFKAPAKPLWYVALGATEWGHYLAVVSILLVYLAWRGAKRWTAASGLACAAAVLFCTPYARATWVAYDLPAQLTEAFGPSVPRGFPQAPARCQPLQFLTLFKKIPSPSVLENSWVYSTVQGETLRLDLYRSPGIRKPLPGVIVVHGGSWKSGDRSQLSEFNRYLAARGYLVASLDYRLAPRALFPAQREDVWAAIRYLKAHAREIGLDPSRLALIGRSAGGQIALAAAYGRADPAIKGVVAFYAPSDLIWGYAHPTNPLVMNSRNVLETYLGGTPKQVPQTYIDASPVLHIDAKTPPTLLIHGVRDELVSDYHDELLFQRLEQVGRPDFYLRMPWATHGCDVNLNGPCGQLSTYAVERFLAAVMPDKKKIDDTVPLP